MGQMTHCNSCFASDVYCINIQNDLKHVLFHHSIQFSRIYILKAHSCQAMFLDGAEDIYIDHSRSHRFSRELYVMSGQRHVVCL